jgi:hypothetical protein
MNTALDSIRRVLGKATQPEKAEPGPGDVMPTGRTKQDAIGPDGKIQFVTIPFTAAEIGEWWKRIERSRNRLKAREQRWDILLNEYLPIVSKSGEAETVKVQQHFRNVHSKIGQLFYRSPDLVLTPHDPSLLTMQMPNPMSQPGQPPLPPLTMEDVVSIKQAVLQQKLGRNGIKANRLMDELLFDVLAWAGIAASKLGYRCVFRPVPGPGGQPGAVLNLAPQSIPVPVYEEWYWRRFSPKKVLWNDDLRSTRFDEDATWMGMEFFMSPKMAMKLFNLSEDEANKAAEDDRVHKYDDDKIDGALGLVHGVELFCKAAYFTDEVHPLALNQLVLIEGIKDRPIVWRPSPDQSFDEMGKLTKDSLIGFPIRVLTVRDLADSPFPNSDSAHTNSLIKQQSTWRRQSIQLRDAQIGKYLYDMGAFEPEEVAKLQSTDVGVWIGVAPGLLANGADKIIAVPQTVHATNDDYRGQQIIQRDIDETLGISAWGAGSTSETVRTATEVANVQANMQGRNDKELDRTLDFYLDGARMIDQLLMRYATETEYIQITGETGAQTMRAWNSQIVSGKYLYDIAPDSSVKVDTFKDFQLASQHWNLVAKSPLTNQAYILRRLARMRGYDPSKAVLPPQSVPKPPDDRFKATISLKGEDLANPLVVKMLVDEGVIKPEDVALNKPVLPPTPEGAADKADTLSAHVASNSGSRPNEPGSSNHRDAEVK